MGWEFRLKNLTRVYFTFKVFIQSYDYIPSVYIDESIPSFSTGGNLKQQDDISVDSLYKERCNRYNEILGLWGGWAQSSTMKDDNTGNSA